MTDADYAVDRALLANTLAKFQLQNQAVGSSDLNVNANKTEFMYRRKRAISLLICSPLKRVDKFTSLGTNIRSTERDVIIYLEKA